MRGKKMLLLLGIITACSLPMVASVFAAPRDVEFRAEAFGDSARVIARWVPAAQGDKGPIDSYAVSWMANAATRTVSRVAPIDTFVMLRPGIGDSVLVSIAVAPVRRGLRGPAKSAGTWLKNLDVPPLPIDSLVLDTLARATAVESVHLVSYTAAGLRRSNGHAVAEGDSLLFVAEVTLKPGRTRLPSDTVDFEVLDRTSDGRGVIALRHQPRSDSVWFVAVSCGCRESGDTANLRFSLQEGRYKYRQRDGRWRDVTPAPLDPFMGARAN